MAISWRSFARFNPLFAVSFVVWWNAMMLLGMWLNGGMGRIHSPSALVVVGLAALSIPAVLVSAFRIESIRAFVFRPNTDLSAIGGDMLVLGAIGSILGIGALASAAFS